MTAVLLRCDATAAGGLGHFVRVMALAEEVGSRGRAAFISGDVQAPLAREMLERSEVEHLRAVGTTAELIDLAEQVGATTVHVDRYEGFVDLRQASDPAAPVTSAAVDGYFGRRAADVVVDGAPRATRVFDPLYADAAVCLGPDYLALRRGLAGAVSRTAGDRVRALVIMGGTDSGGFGPVVARAVRDTVGVSAVGLVGSTAQVPGVVHVPRAPDLTRLVQGWDLVVTAAGTTVWELAALGVPMGLVGVVENQRDHYESLIEAGAAVGLGFLPAHDDIATKSLAEVIADPAACQRMVSRAHRLVDGRGAARIVDAWDAVARDRRTAPMRLRPVQEHDAGRLFAWRNDDETRRQSRNTEPVEWQGHLAWLRDALSRSDRRLYVGVLREPVGTVRLDRAGPRTWEISVTVSPDARGRGLGRDLVDQALSSLAGEDGQLVVAEVRHDNSASRNLFSRLGFRFDSRVGEWERWNRSS